jgi:hypothetical protein
MPTRNRRVKGRQFLVILVKIREVAPFDGIQSLNKTLFV